MGAVSMPAASFEIGPFAQARIVLEGTGKEARITVTVRGFDWNPYAVSYPLRPGQAAEMAAAFARAAGQEEAPGG
jgi:hypothetical protein